jgi:hypothetical protein
MAKTTVPLVLLLFLMATFYASSALGATDFSAKVTRVSAFPGPRSGVVITWVALSVVKDEAQPEQELLLPYMSEDQPQPKVGEKCLFSVHSQPAGGYVGSSFVAVHDAIVIDSFQCPSARNPKT